MNEPPLHQLWKRLGEVRSLSFVANSHGATGWNGRGVGAVVVRETGDGLMTWHEQGTWRPAVEGVGAASQRAILRTHGLLAINAQDEGAALGSELGRVPCITIEPGWQIPHCKNLVWLPLLE